MLVKERSFFDFQENKRILQQLLKIDAKGKLKTQSSFVSLDHHNITKILGTRDKTEKCINRFQNHNESLIPFAIKDNFCTPHLPTTCSSSLLPNYLPSFTSTVLSLLGRNSKYILIGKCCMDEFGCGSFGTNCESQIGNHWLGDEFCAGGSSNGCAYAVSQDAASFAICSDTGGSCRTPAALHNLIGYKPSFGLISRHGMIQMGNELDTVGIISKRISTIKEISNDANDPTLSTTMISKCLSNSEYRPSEFELLIPDFYELIQTKEDASMQTHLSHDVKYRIISGKLSSFKENKLGFSKRSEALRIAINDYFKRIFDNSSKFPIIVLPCIQQRKLLKRQVKDGKTIDNNVTKYDMFTILSNICNLPTLTVPIGEHGYPLQFIARPYTDYELINILIDISENYK
ncbi:MAG: Trimeric GatFAB AmidoTransferase(AdT) complex subunit [Marteilia pararefringens]